MKKMVFAIVCITMVMWISGCAHPSNNAPSNTTTAIPNTESSLSTTQHTDATTQTEDVPVQQIPQSPMVSVSVPITTETETAQDGTVIFNYAYQNMSLIVPDPEVADNVIVDFLNRVDKAAEQAEIIRTAAKENYTSGQLQTPYLCQIIYEPARIDHSILSLLGRYVGYSGSAHPEILYQSANYDLITGNVLTLSHIITPETTADTLCRLIIDALIAQEEKQLYEGFETTVEERFAGSISSEESWYLSSEGLCFYFSPYEIAPYASGVIIAQIPYSDLVGILDDSYFPAELENATGSLFIENYDEDSLEPFSQFSEVILDENGEKYLLYTDKSVYDIRLNVNSEESGLPAYTAFSAYSLTPGDAITVQAPINKKISLSVFCRTGDNTIEEYSFQP